MKSFLPAAVVAALFLSLSAFSQEEADFHDLLPADARDQLMRGVECIQSGGSNCAGTIKKGIQLASKKKGTAACIEVELAKYYYYSGNIDSATYFIRQTQKSLQQLAGKSKERAWLRSETLNTLAMIAYARGDIESCNKYMLANMRLIDSLGNPVSAALVKINVSSNYSAIGDHKNAIRFNLQAYNELQALGKLSMGAVAHLCANLATNYFDNKQPVEAAVWARKAVHLGKKLEEHSPRSVGNYILALFHEKKSPDSALFYADKAIKVAKDFKAPKALAGALSIKARILSSQQRYKEAAPLFKESLAAMKEMEFNQDYVETLKSAALAAHQNHDFRDASNYYTAMMKMSDSLGQESHKRLIHESNIKYETEKKERQIAENEVAIQRQRNQLQLLLGGAFLLIVIASGSWFYKGRIHAFRIRDLKREKEQATLEALFTGEERERNRLSQELHDGIANMVGAAKMQVETLPHLPPGRREGQLHKLAHLLEGIHADVRHIAHDLMPTALETGLLPAVQHYATAVTEMQDVLVTVTAETNFFPTEKTNALMMFRIIQELVGNAWRHGQATRISIHFGNNKEGDFVVTVEDNGNGYDGSEGHGLASIRKRVELLGGDFTIGPNEEGRGSTASLCIYG